MSQPSLVEQIGRQGDRLFADPLPDRDENGSVPIDDDAWFAWSLTAWSTARLDADDHDGQSLAFLVLVPLFPVLLLLDALQLVARVLLYWPVVWVWGVEVWLARRAGRRWFCAACHHSMTEPWLCCDRLHCPRPIQTRLRPTFGRHLFVKSCHGCGQRRWPILGARLWGAPAPLICRHTRTTSGCFRPMRVEALADGTPTQHIVLAGTTVAAKHAALAHLLAAWEGDGFKPGWDVSELEMRLARSILGRAFDADTRPAERPGRSWTLASTLVLAGKGRNLAVHNLLNDWLDRTDELARHSCNWKAAGWLVLAVDGRELTRTPDYDSVTAAEYYSRLVRVAEEYLALPPGATLPFRVAVLVVSPGEGAGRSDLTPEEVESLVRKHDPALAALLTRTAAPGGVAYFGGMVPRGKSLAGWASQAAGVLAG